MMMSLVQRIVIGGGGGEDSSKTCRRDARHTPRDNIYRDDKSIVNSPPKALSVTFRRSCDALIAIVPFERATRR